MCASSLNYFGSSVCHLYTATVQLYHLYTAFGSELEPETEEAFQTGMIYIFIHIL